MIAKFFNKTKPMNTLIELVLLVIFFLFTFLSDVSGVEVSTIFSRLFLLLIVLLSLFLTNFIVRKNSLSKKNSYVILLFVLFIGMFPNTMLSKEILLSNFFLLIAYRRIYSLRSQKNTTEKLFDSAFWIGVATVIHPWCILFTALIYSALNAFNKLTLRNAIIPLVGVITPLFLYGVYLYATDQFTDETFQLLYGFDFSKYNSLSVVVPLALVLGMLLWTVIPTTFQIISVNNEFRASWAILVFNLILSMVVIIPSPVKDGSELLYLFFPASLVFTNYLERVKEKWFKEVFLYLFVTVTIAVYFL